MPPLWRGVAVKPLAAQRGGAAAGLEGDTTP